MAWKYRNPIIRAYVPESARTYAVFWLVVQLLCLLIRKPTIGNTCSACRPRKCAARRSPPFVLQFTIGSPGPPSLTPTECDPWAIITPPMAEAARKITSPDRILKRYGRG